MITVAGSDDGATFDSFGPEIGGLNDVIDSRFCGNFYLRLLLRMLA